MILKITSNSKVRTLLTFGLLDALFVWCLFLIPVLVVALMSGRHILSDLPRFIEMYWAIGAPLMVPLVVFGAWHGALDAVRTKFGTPSLTRVTAEGFVLGFCYCLGACVFGLFQAVYAAGTIYDEVAAQPTHPWAWIRVLGIMLSFCIASGIPGSCFGALIHIFNQTVLRGLDGILHRKIEATV